MLASSSQAQLRYMPEIVAGETPVSGNARNLRMTGETLDQTISRESSNEIDPTRQVSSLFETTRTAQGSINFAWQYKEYDWFLQSLMRSPWVEYAAMNVAGTFSDTADNTIFTADAAPSGASHFTNVKEASFLRAFNNADVSMGIGQIMANSSDTVLTFNKGAFAPGAATVTFRQSYLKIGNTPFSATIEKHFTDVDQFFSYTGMQVSKMDLNATDTAELTGSFSMMGLNGKRTDVSVMPGGVGGAITSQSYRTMSGVTGVKDIRMGGQTLKQKYNTYPKSITLSFDNGLEHQTALGEQGSVGLMAKQIQLNGVMSMYLSSGALYDDFVNAVRNKLSWVTRDVDGNGYGWVFDSTEISSTTAQAASNGQSVMLEANWTALKGPMSLNSMTIYRL